ncbi:MAG: hypothetical protein ACYCSJ_01495 [Acidimicrobiales bacterium]
MAHTSSTKVTTSVTQIAQVPAGHVVTIQNAGATACWVQADVHPAPTQGFLLAGGSPGGSLQTEPPGDDDDQTWYAVTASGSTVVTTMVV